MILCEKSSRPSRPLFGLLAGALATGAVGIGALYLVFMVVPNEVIMGPVQRIFYFHVATAMMSYLCVGVVLLSSLWYLADRSHRADALAEAASEVAFVLCSCTLATGMIWGKVAWNTWFRWEPRLVTFLILWLILLSLTILRATDRGSERGGRAAVLGILAAINVPIVWLSIKLLPASAQLHPEVVGRQGLKDDRFYLAMIVTIAAVFALAALFVAIRYRLALMTRRSSSQAW